MKRFVKCTELANERLEDVNRLEKRMNEVGDLVMLFKFLADLAYLSKEISGESELIEIEDRKRLSVVLARAWATGCARIDVCRA
jgi:hypothetical protein